MAVAAGDPIYASDIAALLPTFARKPADTSRASLTVSANDPDLVIPVAASSYFQLTGVIVYTGDPAADLKGGLVGPTGSTFVGTFRSAGSTAANPGSVTLDSPGINTTPSTAGWVFGTISTTSLMTSFISGIFFSGSGGTLTFAWAQAVTNATASAVRTGSYLLLTPIS